MQIIFSKKIIYLYTFFILFISFFPLSVKEKTENYLDKFVHFFLYFFLAFFLFRSNFFLKKKFLFSFIYCFLLSLITEMIQKFLPWRSFDLVDLLANNLGIGVAFLIFR